MPSSTPVSSFTDAVELPAYWRLGAKWRTSMGPSETALPERLRSVEALLSVPGTLMKSEPRTRIVLSGTPQERERFVIKAYRYPAKSAWRYLGALPKAEREYLALERLGRLGIDTIEPIAYAHARDRLGLVRITILVTRFRAGLEPLKTWLRRAMPESKRVAALEALFVELGRAFRIAHEDRFFLLTPNTKNVLVEQGEGGEGPRPVLIDLPYARELRWAPFRRWAQARDLGQLRSGVPEALLDVSMEAFFEGYGVEGTARRAIEARAARHAAVLRNRTPLSKLIHRWKKRRRHRRRARRTS